MKKMDIILAVLLLTVLAFVVTVIVFNALGLQVQDSLVHAFMGMCSAELVAMGGIKMFNVKYEDKGNAEPEITQICGFNPTTEENEVQP